MHFSMMTSVKNILILSFGYLISSIYASPIDIQQSYAVADLPGLSDIPESVRPIMHAGHLELYSNNNTNYFFWKFTKPDTNMEDETNKLHNNQLIFWLNGGPGCSSMDGALMELGPLRISKEQKVVFNPGSWMEVADVVFVDQPGGTGLSYTEQYVTELDEVAYDFSTFLTRYFEVFPDDIHKDIWIAGESYAGQYIPYVSSKILEENKKETPMYGEMINLKGLLIGNGWIAPNLQSLSYVPFGVEIGLIDKTADYMPKLLRQHERCQNIINSTPSDGDYMDSPQCERILDMMLQYARNRDAPKDQQCVNMYDYRLYDSYPSCGMNWPPDLPEVEPFLNIESVQNSLNMKKHKHWSECDNQVGSHLRPKRSKQAMDLLPDLLAELPIVLFSGDKDIICNSLSTELIIEKLRWNGAKGYTDDAVVQNWLFDDINVGTIISERNLSFVKVFNSSHMVPFDLPEVSRGLFDIISNAVEILDENTLLTPVYDIYNGTYYFTNKEYLPEPEVGSSTISTEVVATTTTESIAATSGLLVKPTPVDDDEDDHDDHKDHNDDHHDDDHEDDDDDDDDYDDDDGNDNKEGDVSSPHAPSNNSPSESSKSWTFFTFEVVIVVVIVLVLRYVYVSYKSKPSSILSGSGSKNRKKKNVHWSDISDDNNDSRTSPNSTFNSSQSDSMISKVLSKLGYSNSQETQYNHLTIDDEENDVGIEMDDQFIIQSDEEDFDHRHQQQQHQ